MKRYTLTGLAALAALAITAVMAAAAMAAAPEIIPASGTLTIKSGVGKLNVKESTVGITCKKDKGTGTVTGAKKASYTVDFEECTTLGGLVKCNSLGDSAGIVLVGGTAFLSLSGTTTVLDFLLPSEIHVECSTTLLLIRGSLICPVTPINKLVKTTEHYTVSCALKETGVNTFTKVINESGTQVTDILETSENGGPYRQSGEETTEEASDSVESEIT